MGREKVENAHPDAYKINLPTKITLLRILLVPFLLAFLIAPSRVNALMAALIFGGAALTDWLDGHLARSTQQVTTLGKLLDPIADKILLAAGLIPLVGLGRVPAWMAAIMLIREFSVSGLREIAAAEQVIIHASPTTPRPRPIANHHASGIRRSEIDVEISIGGNVSPAPENAPFITSSTPVSACVSARIRT